MPCSPIGLHGFLFSYWDWIRNEVYCILLLVYIWVYVTKKAVQLLGAARRI